MDRNTHVVTNQDLSTATADEDVYSVWIQKQGNPNGPGVPEWPQFTEQKREVMYFHDKAFLGPVPSAEGVEALDAYFAWRRTPEGAARAK